MKNKFMKAVAIAFTLGISAPAVADSYPEKPIKLILPFAPGSGTDTVARLVGDRLAGALNQTVIVDNKPGGNGTIAAGSVANAAPDGYTLLVTTNTSHSAAPSLLKKLPYDPLKDFESISRLVNFPFVLVVDPSLPVTSVDELLSYGKSNPDGLTYASGNSTGIVAGASFQKASGVEMTHIPYKSTPQALTDVLGGRVSFMFVDQGTALPHIRAGKLRALAVTTTTSTELLPNVPTLSSHPSFPNFEFYSWNALSAPAGTPAAVIERLNKELATIMAMEDVKSRLATMGIEPVTSTPDEQTRFITQDIENWKKAIADAGITPQ